MIIGVIIIMLLYSLLNYYVGYNLYKFLNLIFAGLKKKYFYIVFSIIVFMSIISFIKIPHTSIISFIGSFYIGLFVYLIMLFLIKSC